MAIITGSAAGTAVRTRAGGRPWILLAAFAAAVCIPWRGAEAYQFKIVYAFYQYFSGGDYPYGGLLMDAAGNLYGTTAYGGQLSSTLFGGGTVFELTLEKTSGKWVEKVLYDFCPAASCTDGESPAAGLFMDAAGNLFGTTQYGGNYRQACSEAGIGLIGCGTVFELSPDRNTGGWTETVLHRFCAAGSCAADGGSPTTGLVGDAAGDVYGTTAYGGGAVFRNGAGTVYRLAPDRASEKFAYSAIDTFCREPYCADGRTPVAGLVMDQSGNLYGAASYGGAGYPGGGTVFELTRDPATGAWGESVVHRFCREGSSYTACRDGAYPLDLTIDSAGNLYGMTAAGGRFNAGTVFELTRDPVSGKWSEAVLYDFGTYENPDSPILVDSRGALYGTTAFGGRFNGGTIFQLARNLSTGTWSASVLHDFNCGEGGYPIGSLVIDASGNLYGAAGASCYGGGFVYELVK
jgi:uncharacterized repeat protein (TIGR03803 family)